MRKKYWLSNSEDKEYTKSTCYRCVGLENFLDKVEKDNNIVVCIVVEGNNIEFILDDKEKVHKKISFEQIDISKGFEREA